MEADMSLRARPKSEKPATCERASSASSSASESPSDQVASPASERGRDPQTAGGASSSSKKSPELGQYNVLYEPPRLYQHAECFNSFEDTRHSLIESWCHGNVRLHLHIGLS